MDDIEGLEEVSAALQKLPAAIVRRILRKAGQRAGDIVQAEIEARAPEQTGETPGGSLPPGALKSDIGYSITTSQDEKGVRVSVGPGKYTAHVARWVEFGHKEVSHGGKKSQRHEIGNVPAHPFMRPAFDVSAEPALEAFIEEVDKNLPDAVREVKTK